MEIVLCEWDTRKGAWRCSSAPGSPYNNKRVDSLSNLVRGMKAEGFEEVTPTLRKVGHFSKSQTAYSPLPIVDATSKEVALSPPPEGPPKPEKTSFRLKPL